MRLLRLDRKGRFKLVDDWHDRTIPPYAILSHTWGADNDEVTFADMESGAGMGKSGYEKIRFCGEQARKDGLQYFWVDTCCINKMNKAELSLAIKSMFRWYRDASRCYVYLADVPSHEASTDEDWELKLRESRWFTRGWTLQELLAPESVEFFSQNWKRVGDRISLKQQIHEISGLPISALDRTIRLPQFSVNERLSWIQHRNTKLEEDKAYSLLGLFGVDISPLYGEGASSAYRRLLDEVKKMNKCLQHLYVTDPRDDKKRIESTKGGLLKESYCWVLENADYQQWRADQDNQLLWVKGDPGKGKTMLLCGIIDELEDSKLNSHRDILSFFFCQAVDSRINNATAVLRGLLYLLVSQQPSLITHVRKRYDHVGEALFDGPNAWMVISEVFTDVLQDPDLCSTCTYLIIDALDECTVSLPKLLEFITNTKAYSQVKWIVSSRNWPEIEEQLQQTLWRNVRLSLELNSASIDTAVNIFIAKRVQGLAQARKYSDKTRIAVLEYLQSNAESTFLWVALVCQNLETVAQRNVMKKLVTFPAGLDSVYNLMIQRIQNLDDGELCMRILATAAVVYRPVTLKELLSITDMLEDAIDANLDSLREIINLCGSFLTVRQDTVYLIHQSAKDFLLSNGGNRLSLADLAVVHRMIFSKSLHIMSHTLHRDMYRLDTPGYTAAQVEPQGLSPLAAAHYSCLHWVDHLCNYVWSPLSDDRVDPFEDGMIKRFIEEKFLYWLEALSLFKAIPLGILSMTNLGTAAEAGLKLELSQLIRDARRFILTHSRVIKDYPLQTYASAMMYSPNQSLIKKCFEKEIRTEITIQPPMHDEWDACLQTLECHGSEIVAVAISHDSQFLASAEQDGTVKIWDAINGECILEIKYEFAGSVAFAHDTPRLMVGLEDGVDLWDASDRTFLKSFVFNSGVLCSIAMSYDSTRIVVGSAGGSVRMLDTTNSAMQSLEGHDTFVYSIAFSHDSTRIASASEDQTIKIWNTSTGTCLHTLMDHSSIVFSAAFSSDSAWLASASADRTIKIWDTISGGCIKTIKGHTGSVFSVAFFHSSNKLVSASADRTVKLWDTKHEQCLQTFEGHEGVIRSMAVSDKGWLAIGSDDSTIKIWDMTGSSNLGHPVLWTYTNPLDSMDLITFSPNTAWLASVSATGTARLWDTSNGICVRTFNDNKSGGIHAIAFAHDSKLFASASFDGTIKIWDLDHIKCLMVLAGRHSDTISQVAFSPDSSQLVSISDDCVLHIWEVSSGICLHSPLGDFDSHPPVAFSRHSALLAVAELPGKINILDLKSSESLHRINICRDKIFSLALNYDANLLASAGSDRTIKVWDIKSGDCILTVRPFKGSYFLNPYHSVYALSFSRDSLRLASTNSNKTITLWDTTSGDCLQTFCFAVNIRNIVFDMSKMSYLHTDIGTIDIASQPKMSGRQRIRFSGISLDGCREWLSYDSRNMIHVPLQYQCVISNMSGCVVSAKSGNTIAVADRFMRVWIYSYKPQNGNAM